MEGIYSRKARLMGSDFEFQVEALNKTDGENLLDACLEEVQRLEILLTEFHPDSETSQINAAAGLEWKTVSSEVFDLLARCRQLSELTQGAFDVTGVVLRSLYNFKGESFAFPKTKSIKDRLNLIGYQHIELEKPNQARLSKKGMRIGFGAIGKGFAAEMVKQKMIAFGVKSGAINASGDLCVWGNRPDHLPWKIGIAKPDQPEEMLCWLNLHNASIATSGNYIQFFEHGGKRYSHNLDPKTGLPVVGIKSVSIISPSAELSDGLATAVFVLGVDLGIDLLNQLPQTHGLVVDENNQIFTSKHLNLSQINNP